MKFHSYCLECDKPWTADIEKPSGKIIGVKSVGKAMTPCCGTDVDILIDKTGMHITHIRLDCEVG